MIHHLNKAVRACGTCLDLHYTFGSATGQLSAMATHADHRRAVVTTQSAETCA